MNIQRIDMHIRDERLLNWLSQRDNQQIPARHIADELRCHKNTARAMLQRLEGAGRIQITRINRRGGYTYKVMDTKSCES